MSYLSNFKELNEGYVIFGGRANGGRITSKGTIKTSNLDFEDVYFVKELKFNLCSVSQMCDRKNNVLFTDTECLVLSPNFKLPDESQILLRVPRKNNMYSVDMKNIVPKKSLTCLVAKATLDESMLWHRTLGHINFKNINKLVKDNLVRATKDETTDILKKFITEIENLVDNKVKVIRCDNRTEFKNSVMNDFCAMKAYSKLPTTSWAEAVNTACYVQNRILIVKPHNKTSYELFRGRTPALSFMRLFGCHVTILNTLDHLGKFNEKAYKGFFVGYSMNSKAFRVYNIKTRRVEENLHIEFLVNKPIVAGDGPEWLFDIDILTKLMSYVPVVADTNSNDFAAKKDSIGADDLKMPGLEIIENYDDSEEEADFTKFESSIHVSHTPTTRIHKNHPLKQVTGSVNTPVQIMSKLKPSNEQGFISVVYEGKTHEDCYK
uniref:Ribonuclease H-like domain-containing protein n=1 Tax=Tanacetum cinerariifolium TaxID=118510 RepID=A0A6L2N8T8_TANCI|nr:ribonuclease H-like domain-containing protein [Tanacetum cinerariifolium]